MKTARFTDIVKRSGVPEAHALWTAVNEDKAFQRADKERRVMTIHQEPSGQKKDYGIIGYREEPKAQYFVFPKSLKRFEQKRIIGIDYALLAPAGRPPRAKTPHKLRRSAADLRPAPNVKAVKHDDSSIVAFSPPPDLSSIVKLRGPSPVASVKSKETVRVTALPPVVVREIHCAMKELRAGQAVPAYERLEKLIRLTPAGD